MSNIAVLIGLAMFTVLSLAYAIRLWVRKSRPRRATPLQKAIIGAFLFLVAGIAARLFWQALLTDETYCLGRRCRRTPIEAAQDPIAYWIAVAIWYTLAWLALAAAFFVVLRRRK